MGQNNIVRIPTKGDLVRAATLRLTLPPLAVYGQEWLWPEKPGFTKPTVNIDGTSYIANVPFGGQYYASNILSFNQWASSIPGVIYDQNSDKFIFTSTQYVAVLDPTFAGNLIGSAVFWGFDPKNYSYSNGQYLIYNSVNGKVIPDFTLEQAGWARTIGDPINTLSGIFLQPNQEIDGGYINFLGRNMSVLVWNNYDMPAAYTITNGGRIKFTQLGSYIIRTNFQLSFGADGSDGPPILPVFTNISVGTNSLIPGSSPIQVVNLNLNWYFYSTSPGTYISIEPMNDFYTSNTVTNVLGNPFPIFELVGQQIAIFPGINNTFAFTSEGQWLISGTLISNEQGSVNNLVTTVQIINMTTQSVSYTYDMSNQLGAVTLEFFIPVVVKPVSDYYAIYVNTVNGLNNVIFSSQSFITFTYLGLPIGGTPLYPNGGLILPLNGLLFKPSGSYEWDTQLASPCMELTNNNLTVTMTYTGGDLEPTMLTQSIYATGTKNMFSVTINQFTPYQTTAVGIGNFVMNTASYLGADLNSVGYCDDGTFYANGINFIGGSSFSTGSVVDIAVDTQNYLIWVRVDGGDWSSNVESGPPGDPSIGSYGFDISYIIGGYKFGVEVFNDGRIAGQITLNKTSLYSVPFSFNFKTTSVISDPLNFANFNEYGVESMISLDAGSINFPNIGTYMITSYLPLANSNLFTWDQNFAFINNLFLSNQNLTVTSYFNAKTPTIFVTSIPTSTKIMYSVTIDQVSSDTRVGIAIGSFNTGYSLGVTNDSFGYRQDGTSFNGTQLVVGDTFSTGSIVDVAIDMLHSALWVRVDGGNWSSSAGGTGGDPYRHINGFDISYLISPFRFGISTVYPGQVSYNTANVYSVPTDFTFIPGVPTTTKISNLLINGVSYPNPNSQDVSFVPTGLCVTGTDSIYITDSNENLLLKSDSSGVVNIVAGGNYGTSSGYGLSAYYGGPSYITNGPDGSIYASDVSTLVVSKTTPDGHVFLLAGNGISISRDGQGKNSSFINPSYIATSLTSTVYVVDFMNIRMIDSERNTYTLSAEAGNPFVQNPERPYYGEFIVGITVDSSSNIYFSTNMFSINQLPYGGGSSLNAPWVGKEQGFLDGPANVAQFLNIKALTIDPSDNIYVLDENVIRKITPTGDVTTLSASGGFFTNPTRPVIIPTVSQTPFSYFNGSLYYITEQIEVAYITISNALITQFLNIIPGNIKLNGGSTPVNIPIRTAGTFDISIGNDGASLDPSAYIWIYPITSSILPIPASDYHYYDSVGTWTIESADLKIGGQTIESLTGEAIEIWNDLKVPYENQPGLTLLTGKYDTTIASGRDYYINLPFYFYENSGSYLPISIINRQDVEIWITFKTLQQLTAIQTPPNPVQASLIVEYVYLAQPEIFWLSKTNLDYVIEQYQYQEISLGQGFTQGNFELIFENPVKELYFIIQIDGSLPYDWSNDGLANLGISINGEEFVTNRITDAIQLGTIEPLENFINFPTRNFYMKKFKSSINFSRLRQVILELNILRADGYYPSKKLRIIAVNRNVMRVADGLAGLMFISQ